MTFRIIQGQQATLDVSIGAAAVSSLAWWPYVEETLKDLMLAGGVVIIGLRIALMVREWRKG